MLNRGLCVKYSERKENCDKKFKVKVYYIKVQHKKWKIRQNNFRNRSISETIIKQKIIFEMARSDWMLTGHKETMRQLLDKSLHFLLD